MKLKSSLFAVIQKDMQSKCELDTILKLDAFGMSPKSSNAMVKNAMSKAYSYIDTNNDTRKYSYANRPELNQLINIIILSFPKFSIADERDMLNAIAGFARDYNKNLFLLG